MNTILGFTYGIILTLIATTYLIAPPPEPVTVHDIQIIERTRTEHVTTTLDLEQLKSQIAGINDDLHAECINIIERHTGDPKAGIIIHVERHYQGDACQAADQAIHGRW